MDSGRAEAVPVGAGHLDTVRALHQTVVSLRTALETSKNELKELKEKYEHHSHCIEYADVIEKLTLENHILRRRIIDSEYEEKDPAGQDLKLEVTYSPHSKNIEEYASSEVGIATATDRESVDNELDFIPKSEELFGSSDKLNKIPEEVSQSELHVSEQQTPGNDTNTEVEELSQVLSLPEEEENREIHQPSFKTKLELLSKFDVCIKVRTIQEGTVVSSTTSETNSTTDWRESKEFEKESKEHSQEQFINKNINIKSVSTDNIKMAVPNEGDVKSKTDKFDVQVRITSEENLVVKENLERSRRKDTLNLDVDDLSLRSMSEGDNSVFSEGGTTPIRAAGAATAEERKDQESQDQENASGNESEEVDDIELIFTTDESKDMSNLQEDLVSITEPDQWASHSTSTTHSTPVLIKFHTLDPDFQPRLDSKGSHQTDTPNRKQQIQESTLKKRVSLPNVKHVAFNSKGSLELPGKSILKGYDNKSDNMLYKMSPACSPSPVNMRPIDSIVSLTRDYNKSLTYYDTSRYKSSSFELGSSMDMLHRDESVDSFRSSRFGHRYSVFAETDISKCGTSEDDLSAILNVRRNTCPNPSQYRVIGSHRVSRPPGPFKVPSPAGRLRPVLRDAAHSRRENAAQTDMSALPPKWSSDGYLSHKMSVPSNSRVPTVPQRGAGGAARRLTVPDARPPPLVRRNDEARRVMLSDIGFTSMVPELSRSADPVWALGKRPPRSEDYTTSSTSKYLSRASSHRSPSLSVDMSNDWTQQQVYVPPITVNRMWRSSLPDMRRDDTEELLEEAETFVRRSIENLHSTDFERVEVSTCSSGEPYIPSEPRQLRLGHDVKVITPHGRIAVGRVRYVGLAGGSAASSALVVGAEFLHAQHPGLARNDGTHKGRRYFLTAPSHTALFLPFSKVVMAWAN